MKRLSGLVLALILPIAVFAQSPAVEKFQDKYRGEKHASFVTIEGNLFKFVAGFAEMDDDPELQAFGRIADGLRSMRVLSMNYFDVDLSKADVANLKDDLRKEKYESLMSVKDGRQYVDIMAKGSDSEIRDIVIVVDDKDDFTLLSLEGRLSTKDLAYLSRNHKEWH